MARLKMWLARLGKATASPLLHTAFWSARQSLLSNHTQPTKWYVYCAIGIPKKKEAGADCIQAPAATGGKKQKKKWSKGKGT